MIVGELVTRALRRAALPGIEAPSAEDMRDGIDRLNEMLAAWALEGIDLKQPTLAQADEFYVDPAHVKAIVDCLAVELAVDHGVSDTIPVPVQMGAASGKDHLRAALFEMDDLTADSARLPRGHWFDFSRG
jgi:hypothetical protein